MEEHLALLWICLYLSSHVAPQWGRLTHLNLLLLLSWSRLMDIWCHGGDCGNNRGIKNGFFPSDSSWEILPFNLPPAAAEIQHRERTPLSFQFRQPPRSPPVINRPQVGKGRKCYSWMWELWWRTGKKDIQCCVRLPSATTVHRILTPNRNWSTWSS